MLQTPVREVEGDKVSGIVEDGQLQRATLACDDPYLPMVQAGNLRVLLGVLVELRRVNLSAH